MTAMPAVLPLDEQLYDLAPDELAFLKSQTGLGDDEALKRHVLAVQAEAYKIRPYPCIRSFHFAKLMISRMPAYRHVLEIGRNRPNSILLDLGCCFGSDVRKVVADGYPVGQIIASDIRPEFWDLGHVLFKSTPATFPVPFIPGDALDPAHMQPSQPVYETPSALAPALNTLTSLLPLRGHVSIIYVGSFFHLFGEEEQTRVASALAGLLSPVPGSVIFGAHMGLPETGFGKFYRSEIFCHSPASWEALWDGQLFRKGSVVVKATLVSRQGPLSVVDFLVWSVTRV